MEQKNRGVGDTTALSAFFPSTVSFGTWNCRALASQEARKREAMLSYLLQHAVHLQVICLQEVHGNANAVEQLLQPLPRTHNFKFWQGKSEAEGGLLIAWSRNFDARGVAIEPKCLIQGRAASICFQLKNRNGRVCSFTVFGVHFFDWTVQQRQYFLRECNASLDQAARCPQHFTSVILGDFNFLSEGDVPVLLDGTKPAAKLNQVMPRHIAEMQACLGKAIDVHGDIPTRYDHANSQLRRIDKIFVAAPSWYLMRMHSKATVASCPMWMNKKGLSDHALLIVRLCVAKRSDLSAFPLPKWVTKTPRFQAVLTAMLAAAELHEFALPARILKVKQYMREAHDLVRNEMLLDFSKQSLSCIFVTLSRCITLNNSALLHFLWDRHPWTKDYVGVQKGSVFVRNQAKFRDDFESAKRGLLHIQRDSLEQVLHKQTLSKSRRAQFFSRFACNASMAKLWVPVGKQLVLAAITDKASDEVFMVFPRIPLPLCNAWPDLGLPLLQLNRWMNRSWHHF